MVKISKRGDNPAPSFALWIIVALGVFVAIVIIFYPKTLEAADIIFNSLGFDNEDESITIGQSEIPIENVVNAYEICKNSKGDDCLCNSNIDLDIPINTEFVIKKSGSDIEVTYYDNSQKIENVEFCVIQSIVRPPEYTFFDAINNEFNTQIEFVKAKDNGKIVSYSSVDRRVSFETSPLKLFRHEENEKLYLCLAKSGIGYKVC